MEYTRMVSKYPILLTFLTVIFFNCTTKKEIQYPSEKPNILWLVSEDNSASTIGAYGNTLVKTPTIDSLAQASVLFKFAYSNAPVCAIARSTILSGMYAGTNGTQHMRSRIDIPLQLEQSFFPLLLKEEGYYTTNNAKTDYNLTGDHARFWSESSPSADYTNREEGQPFFAIHNFHESHESRMHIDLAAHQTTTSAEKITLPPYHPDTQHMKKSWAHYYDKINEVDQWVKKELERLKAQGLEDNTIVFYYADHGGVLPRSKRFMYDTGTRVPMIVHVPDRWKSELGLESGMTLDEPVSFVDLAPTVLALAGIEIPEVYQGASIFETSTQNRDWIYLYRDRMDEWYDAKRGVTNGQFRYVKNFMPHRPNGQHLTFLFKAQSTQEWYELWKNGMTNEIQSQFWEPVPSEQFFVTAEDPWEVENLLAPMNGSLEADKMEMLAFAKSALDGYILEYRDGTFLPEDMFGYVIKKSDTDAIETVYDYLQSDEYPIEYALEVANKVIEMDLQNWSYFLDRIQVTEPVIRYWAAVGLASLSSKYTTINEMPDVLIDRVKEEPFSSVKASLFEAMSHINTHLASEKRISESQMQEWINVALETNDDIGLLYLLNGLHYAKLSEAIQKKLVPKMYEVAFDENYELIGPEGYSRRIAAYLYEIWG